MSKGHLPLWLKPGKENKVTRERLRSLGPVTDLSKPIDYVEECITQSLQSLNQHSTPIATVAPLRENSSKSYGELRSRQLSLRAAESQSIEFGDSETASLPDSTRQDFEVYQPTRQAWTPAATRRRPVYSSKYGSLQSFDSFSFSHTHEIHSGAMRSNHLNQSQPFLAFESTHHHKPEKRKKTFLSQSRDRLDHLVGKLSAKKDEDYRSAQQRKRREGTLSPRSTEYSLMIQRATHVKPGSESGYEPGQSSASDISTDRRTDRRILARRRWFAHYDAQSTIFEFEPLQKLFERMNRRSYIATGASAAVFNSALDSEVGSEDELQQLANTLISDNGDGVFNNLVVSCPQFRNEIGREEIPRIASTRPEQLQRGEFRQVLDTGKSATVLEGVPKPVNGFILECQDNGQKYYSKYFMNSDHSNYIAEDERFGPICVSIRREKKDEIGRKEKSLYLYRVIVRTTSLNVLRGSILEELIPLGRNSHSVSQRDCLMHILPEVDLSCLRRTNEDAKELLQKLDEKSEQEHIKVGVLLCRKGQSSEEEMYNNQHSTALFDDFLKVLGTKVRLKGFTGFRAGLDVREDSTGPYSVHTTHRDTEIMFHVSTMLPYSAQNIQQVDRKRHIGNDIITIIFQEPGAVSFSPATIRSQFQHIFIIVRANLTVSGGIRYSVAVTRAKCVPSFGPAIPAVAMFAGDGTFRDFLLAKIINGRNVMPKVGKFATLSTDMRMKFLRNILDNCTMDGNIESSSTRFSIFRRTEKRRTRVPAEIESRGGLVWVVESLVPTVGTEARLYTFFLVLSHEQLALVIPPDKWDKGIFQNLVPGTSIFSIYPKALLGWTLWGDKDLIIFYGNGDCIQLSLKNKNERSDLITRLECVSRGIHGLYPPATMTKTVVINRKLPGSQLGFHISYEGFVNQVDDGSPAYSSGLQKGSRIVQINNNMLATMSHEEMIEGLRSLPQVVLSVLQPTGLTGQSRYTPRDVWTLVPRLPDLHPEDTIVEEVSTEEDIIPEEDDVVRVLDDDDHDQEHDQSGTESVIDMFESFNQDIIHGQYRDTFRDKVEDIVRRQSPKTYEQTRRSTEHLTSPLFLSDSIPFSFPSISAEHSPRSNQKDQLTASALLGLDDRKMEKSMTDIHKTGLLFDKSVKKSSPIKASYVTNPQSSPSLPKRTLPRHLQSIKNLKRDSQIVFCNFKNGSMQHPPSRRRDRGGREQSLPRASDKLHQDLLNLITEPVKQTSSYSQSPAATLNSSGRADSTDDDLSPRKFNNLTEADRQFSEFHQNPAYSRGRSPRRSSSKKSLQQISNSTSGPDELQRQVEELRVRLDEEQSRNQQLANEVTTLREANLKLNTSTKPRKIDYV